MIKTSIFLKSSVQIHLIHDDAYRKKKTALNEWPIYVHLDSTIWYWHFKFLFLFKLYYNTPIVKAENKYQNKELFYWPYLLSTMADFWGWGAGMVGVAVRCNWRLEKKKTYFFTQKKHSADTRKYTYTSGFLFCLVVWRALLLCLRGSCSGRSCQGWT